MDSTCACGSRQCPMVSLWYALCVSVVAINVRHSLKMLLLDGFVRCIMYGRGVRAFVHERLCVCVCGCAYLCAIQPATPYAARRTRVLCVAVCVYTNAKQQSGPTFDARHHIAHTLTIMPLHSGLNDPRGARTPNGAVGWRSLCATSSQARNAFARGHL